VQVVNLFRLVTGCGGFQSSFNPAGDEAKKIYDLHLLYVIIMTVVFVLVVAFLLLTMWQARGQRARLDSDDAPMSHPDARRERRMGTVVSVAMVLTVVILFVLLVSEFATARAMHSISRDPNPLVVKVIGHQWWWEVRYDDPIPS